MIFNIQKCSIHDGEGLRTLVFFKGCPLRCLWCANPESQSYKPEIMESPVRCIGCGSCRAVCPEGAVGDVSQKFKIDREKCVRCFKCVQRCYAESKRIVGKDYTPQELLKEIEKDRPFYKLFGGGVTFSGGEPLTHPDMLEQTAKLCRERDIDVTIESCGMGDFEKFKKALPYINQMFFDIKHIDSGVHKILTGSGNELILENIKKISDFGIPITVRTPVIPGYNDSADNITGIARFIKELDSVKGYELLPYHRLGEGKYKSLGIDYKLDGISPPPDEQIQSLVRQANAVLDGSGRECFYTKDNKKEVIK